MTAAASGSPKSTSSHHQRHRPTPAAAAAKSLQSCPTLCDPRDGSPPGSPVPGILQARTLEWVAIFFSNALKWKMKVKLLSRVRLFATPWTAAYQAPPSIGFSRQDLSLDTPKVPMAILTWSWCGTHLSVSRVKGQTESWLGILSKKKGWARPVCHFSWA